MHIPRASGSTAIVNNIALICPERIGSALRTLEHNL